jgi:PBP1b-binding outer membrane lipoprotein LpoB
MKKAAILILALLIAFVLVGCNVAPNVPGVTPYPNNTRVSPYPNTN